MCRRLKSMCPRAPICATLLAGVLAACVAPPAGATIVAPAQLDGPSANVLEVDGAALAPDGTGGVVYRQMVNGVPHVFVSRFLHGAWQAPIQVDVGQLGPATDPRIAAADGGELLVVWVQPWMWISASPGAAATLHYALMSAVLQSGAQSFSQIERVDDVGDGTAAYPSLAMAPDGSAYVAYRVVTNSLINGSLPLQPMRAGDELVEVRVARFNGLSWSSLGAMNGLLGQVTMRKPSASNAPVVGVNSAGQAIVLWQEPNIEGVARIWARRLFGSTKGNTLEVSPASIAGSAVTAEADAPALALGEYGQAEVAFRLDGGSGSSPDVPEVMLNTLTMPVAEEVSAFTGAVTLGSTDSIGEPSVTVDGNGDYRVAYTANGSTQLSSGKEGASNAPAVLGSGSGAALVTLDPEGGESTAWPTTDPAGQPAIELRQDFPDGAFQTGYLSAPISGPIADLVAAGSGSGDELIAFRQGSSEDSQVIASIAQAAPAKFYANVPGGWVKASAATVEWQPATESIGSVTYSVLVDGRVLASGLTGLAARLDSRELGDGVRRVQVLATDDLGQETMSPTVDLKVQSNPPLVSVRHLSHRRVEVRIYGDDAGVESAETVVAFGDGTTTSRRDTVIHAYRAAGRYTIVVHATDKVGNTRDAHVRVRIG
jgi:hypothetical protein